jgi:type I restriction enzyme S subunit
MCAFLNRGAAPSYVDREGLMVLNQKCVRDGRVLLDQARRTDPTVKRISKERVLKPFDVLVNSTGVGTLGRVAQVLTLPEAATVDSHITIVRADPQKVFPRYLGFALRNYQPEIEALAEGSTGQTELSRARLAKLRIALPPPLEQQAIACILGALDDKIESNRRMNRTLEDTARAIFKSWFVDFDPVRAKASGQKPPGLKPEIAALFPDFFEDSEVGEIPRGWTVTSLADQITANKGLSYKGQHLCQPGEGLPMHNLNSVYEGGGYKYEGLKWYNGEYRPAHLLKPRDVIVTNTEQGFDYLLIGYAAIVPERYGPQGLFSHHIFRIQQKATSYLPAWFTYLLLRTQHFHNVVAGHTNGTTVNMLPLDGLQKPKFALPPREIVGRFGHLFIPTQQRLEGIYDDNVFLADLRDALLPRLISGELVVTEAERIAGRCA